MQQELMSKILAPPNTNTQLREKLDVTHIMQYVEGQGNPENIQFLVDQIKESKEMVDKGKFTALPQEVQDSVRDDQAKFDKDFAMMVAQFKQAMSEADQRAITVEYEEAAKNPEQQSKMSWMKEKGSKIAKYFGVGI